MTATEPDFQSYMDWASQWNVESLGREFGLTGTVLEDVAFTLQQVLPSPLIRQSVDSVTSLFPLTADVIVSAPMAMIAADGLRIGDTVQFQRDYELIYNRNAITCYVGREYLGVLSNDNAQFLAPMMDAGSEYDGVVKFVAPEGLVKRLSIAVSPVTTA